MSIEKHFSKKRKTPAVEFKDYFNKRKHALSNYYRSTDLQEIEEACTVQNQQKTQDNDVIILHTNDKNIPQQRVLGSLIDRLATMFKENGYKIYEQADFRFELSQTGEISVWTTTPRKRKFCLDSEARFFTTKDSSVKRALVFSDHSQIQSKRHKRNHRKSLSNPRKNNIEKLLDNKAKALPAPPNLGIKVVKATINSAQSNSEKTSRSQVSVMNQVNAHITKASNITDDLKTKLKSCTNYVWGHLLGYLFTDKTQTPENLVTMTNECNQRMMFGPERAIKQLMKEDVLQEVKFHITAKLEDNKNSEQNYTHNATAIQYVVSFGDVKMCWYFNANEVVKFNGSISNLFNKKLIELLHYESSIEHEEFLTEMEVGIESLHQLRLI